ncbi:AAA domain-containing protein [Actinomadura meyerae]|uniref:AAA domain-containing protein n=1 Tax=Actinomadura meyerae TaxID=240840 RepID=A0A239NXF3_9ACTN|nr:AAA family ATPase [Actinomadura meyerae]SNT59098.1 AAA domain-containing protein [Actinomadura meyerae]
MTALEKVLDALREAGHPVTRSGDGWRSTCPAHDGENRTALAIDPGRDGVLMFCHADITCKPEVIARALGLTVRDLFDQPKTGDPRRAELVATYDYVDENGELLYQVCRYSPKTFRQRRPDGPGRWTWSVKGVRQILYRLPAVLQAAAAGQTVYVVEGEKDVHAVEKAGAVATCNAGGAGKWRAKYAGPLTGAHVVIVADKDAPGRTHARQVKASLDGRAASVRVVQAVVGKDVADHLAAGRTLDELAPLDDGQAVPDEQDTPGARRVRSQPLTQITRRRRQYLWEHRLPLGEVTLWVGHAGIGKSQAAVWLAARVSRGELPGELYGTPTPVLYLGTEDSWEYTLAPRFDAAGADSERVFRLYVENEHGDEEIVSLAVDLDTLREEIRATGARLVVLDALLSTFGSAKLTEQGTVRRHLEPLARLAQELGIAVVGVAHFRKASDSNPLHMIAGSSEFGQVVRSAIGFAPDKDADDGSCILSLIKTNLAPSSLPSLRYIVEPCGVQTDEGLTDVGRFVLLGETEQSIEDVLNREHTTAEQRSEVEQAAEWLLSFLESQKDGWEAPRAEVVKAAGKEGFTLPTLNRAKVRAKVRHKSGGFPKTTIWIHPEFATDSDDAQSSHPRETTAETTGGETTGDDWTDQQKQPDEESSAPQSSQRHVSETTEGASDGPTGEPITHSDKCAVPDCPAAPRRSCWTCADHMAREDEFTEAA